MRYLILADIHGNLPALEAVLAAPEATACGRIISLGDQVNYGPQSREVLQKLIERNAVMLLGNHEERLHHLDAPELQGYNWSMLHWTARQVQGFSMDLPVDLRIGNALFTHGMPGDPYKHLKTDDELPAFMDALPPDVTHLFSGHAHRPWYVRHGNRLAVNPGSAGAGKGSGSCQATYAIYDDLSGTVSMHAAPYDGSAVARAFLRSGAIQAAPMMCRIVQQTIFTGCEDSVTALMRHISAVGKPLGLTLADEAAWQAADTTFAWTEPLSTADYWKMMEDKLL